MKTTRQILLLLWCLACMAFAESVTLAWDANPPEQGIAHYELSYARVPELPQKLAVHGATQTTVDLAPGLWTFSVKAVNVRGVVSPDSETITWQVLVPPTAPKGLRVVEIQTSANLSDWKTIALVPQDSKEAPAGFVRARLTTISQLGGATLGD